MDRSIRAIVVAAALSGSATWSPSASAVVVDSTMGALFGFETAPPIVGGPPFPLIEGPPFTRIEIDSTEEFLTGVDLGSFFGFVAEGTISMFDELNEPALATQPIFVNTGTRSRFFAGLNFADNDGFLFFQADAGSSYEIDVTRVGLGTGFSFDLPQNLDNAPDFL